MAGRTMFDRDTLASVIGRLRRLTPETPRRWGRMSAPQMIAHLTDQMMHALGDRPCTPVKGPLRWPPLRWASIYLLPWPKGRIQGPPDAFVTRPQEWKADMAALEKLLERFAAKGPDAEWVDHGLFGTMTGKDWGFFCHKHFDHHLRQFGV